MALSILGKKWLRIASVIAACLIIFVLFVVAPTVIASMKAEVPGVFSQPLVPMHFGK